jgi:hypothetical protein
MQQSVIFEAISALGLNVKEFSDGPASFGSWYVIVARERDVLRVAYDGREHTLFLAKRTLFHNWIDLQSKHFYEPSDSDLLKLTNQWLAQPVT